MSDIDPYQKWFGIPAKNRPLNHYLLLGLRPFEEQPDLIQAAYQSRMEELKKRQTGQHGELSQRLMTEVTQAKLILLETGKKAVYDSFLAREIRLQTREATKGELYPEDSELTESRQQGRDPNTNERWRTNESIRASRPTIPQAIQATEVEMPYSSPSMEPSDPGSGEPAAREPLAELSAREPLGEPADREPVWDWRIIASLTLTAIAAMLATVWVLSDREDTSDVSKIGTQKTPVVSEEVVPNDGGKEFDNIDELNPTTLVLQAADGSFDARPELGLLSGSKIRLAQRQIVDWQPGDTAQWRLDSKVRRKGFFDCEIEYRAERECQFSIKLGARPARLFTIYPQEKLFTEQVIVRLDRLDEQLLTIESVTVATNANVQIKRIKLIPK